VQKAGRCSLARLRGWPESEWMAVFSSLFTYLSCSVPSIRAPIACKTPPPAVPATAVGTGAVVPAMDEKSTIDPEPKRDEDGSDV